MQLIPAVLLTYGCMFASSATAQSCANYWNEKLAMIQEVGAYHSALGNASDPFEKCKLAGEAAGVMEKIVKFDERCGATLEAIKSRSGLSQSMSFQTTMCDQQQP